MFSELSLYELNFNESVKKKMYVKRLIMSAVYSTSTFHILTPRIKFSFDKDYRVERT